MSKGDKITLEYKIGADTSNAVTIEARSNGATVVCDSGRVWTEVTELSKAERPIRTLKVKTTEVIGYLEEPRPLNKPAAAKE